jgi:hypothetical protein
MKINYTLLGGVTLFAFTLSMNTFASDMSWVEPQLEEFHQKPEKFLKNQSTLLKYDPETGEPVNTLRHFSDLSISTKNYIFEKDLVQKSVEKRTERLRQASGRAGIQGNDRPENLVDTLTFKNIQQMDGVMSGSVEVQPWSDDYWALYKGSAGARYADPSFPNSADWNTNIRYILSRPNQSNPDYLSPAEKYDMLVGVYHKLYSNKLEEKAQTLTYAMLQEGAGYYQRTGRVEPWMGICHGWAPAAMAVPRPTHAIAAKTPYGTTINFYPSDIKALESLLWAKGRFAQKLIGSRCNEKDPQRDANGRVISNICFDTNPGTFHQVIVNQVGVNKKSLIIDATFDYEVWNQPVSGYEYVYFNPKTRKTVSKWQDGIVKTGSFPDLFSRYRKGSYILGVAMKFIYIAETKPSHVTPDSPARDKRVAVNYLYDLELDPQMNIIGGEWYGELHPDFLWAPASNARASSIGDDSIGRSSWDGYNVMTQNWKNAAIYSAQSSGQPLAGIVDALAVRSKMGR